jgi:hypothetical protein
MRAVLSAACWAAAVVASAVVVVHSAAFVN